MNWVWDSWGYPGESCNGKMQVWLYQSGAPDLSIWWLSVIMKDGSHSYGWDVLCKSGGKTEGKESKGPRKPQHVRDRQRKKCGKGRMWWCFVCRYSQLLKILPTSLPFSAWMKVSVPSSLWGVKQKGWKREVWWWKGRQGLKLERVLWDPRQGHNRSSEVTTSPQV